MVKSGGVCDGSVVSVRVASPFGAKCTYMVRVIRTADQTQRDVNKFFYLMGIIVLPLCYCSWFDDKYARQLSLCFQYTKTYTCWIADLNPGRNLNAKPLHCGVSLLFANEAGLLGTDELAD